MGLRLIGYCRVSSHGQIHNTSFATQAKAITNFCLCAGHQLACIRTEQQSAGGKIARAVFESILQDLQNNLADGLIVYSLDRFARSALQGLEVAKKLHDCGKQLLVVDVSLDTSTPVGQCMLTVLLAFAQLERDMFAQRVRDGKDRVKERNGFVHGRPCFGWTTGTVAGHKGLLPIPAQQELWHQIIAWRAEGTTYQAITNRLNEAHLTTRAGKRFSNKTIWNLCNQPYPLNQWALSQNNHSPGLHGNN